MIFASQAELKERIESCANRRVSGPVRILEDTTEYMSLLGGDVLRLGGNDFFILGDAREGRFGINEQPKFWVKQCLDLETGAPKVIKLVFHEDFLIQIGDLQVRASRSAEKESRVLDIVRGHPHFMQGETVRDVRGNCVRIIDFIRGQTLFATVIENPKSHLDYVREDLPDVLTRLIPCIEAMGHLASRGEHHGDIRNDHVLIDRDSGLYRWIDFDLEVASADYDLWSVGNLLIFVTGKGIHSIKRYARNSSVLSPGVRVTPEDASSYYPYRLANLRLVFPHIPPRLNDILMRFSVGTQSPYGNFAEIVTDLRAAIEDLRALR